MDNKKMKASTIVLFICLVIFLIAIIGMLIHTIRNYNIIIDLQNKVSSYSSATNYHIKTSYDSEDVGHVETDFYRKNDKRAFFTVNTNSSGEVNKMLTYDNGKRVDFFAETPEKKIAQIGSAVSPNFVISNGLETDSNFRTFILSFFANIRSVKYDDKDCYMIRNFMSADLLYDADTTSVSYIEKETGLELSRTFDGKTEQKIVEFDNVDDAIFVEPNIGEYDIIENS